MSHVTAHAESPVPAPGGNLETDERKRATGFVAKTKAYVALSKPRIIELLLVTTVPTMILANRGLPNLWLLLATLVGGTLSAASANAFNCYIDRDIDRIMNRTKARPLVTGELSDQQALRYAWITGFLSIGWLGLFTNWFASALSALAIILYVVGYTLILKRRTEQNIIWGGAAGCMPVLIGWAAVTGDLSAAPAVLFGIIFLWTPPHYWPLAVKYRDDYSRAEVPMLPVMRGKAAVGLQIVLYGWAMVVCSLLLIPLAPMGWIYTVSALVSGAWFISQTHVLYAESLRGNGKRAMTVFHGSIAYLSVLFIAIAIDPLVYLPL